MFVLNIEWSCDPGYDINIHRERWWLILDQRNLRRNGVSEKVRFVELGSCVYSPQDDVLYFGFDPDDLNMLRIEIKMLLYLAAKKMTWKL